MIDGYRWVRDLCFPSISIMPLYHIFLVDTRYVSYDTSIIAAMESYFMEYGTHHVPRVVSNKGYSNLGTTVHFPKQLSVCRHRACCFTSFGCCPLLGDVHDELEAQELDDPDAMGIHCLADVWPTQYLATNRITYY